MSFVQRLRMANMFPVRSNFASARIDDSGNDMNEVIEAGKELALWNRDVLNSQNKYPRNYSGIDAVAAMGRPKIPGTTLEEPLKFGGVTNPGAMAQNPMGAVRDDIYNKQSQPPPEVGMSNDNKLFWQRQDDNDIDSQLNRRVKESQIKENERQAESAGKPKVITIADPNDPTKQINVNYNPDGSITPITLPNGGNNPQSGPQAKLNAVDATKATDKANARKVIVENTTATLNLLNDLLDPKTNELTPEAERATGWSAAGNIIPGSMGRTGSAKIDRLAGRQVLDLISEMKNQSRTGATGFGQMNIKELELLQNSASMLNDKWLGTEAYKNALKDVRDRLQKVLLDEPADSTMKPAISHSTDNASAQGRIRVKDKATGKTGTISEAAFNPAKYDRVQ